jgi:XTP/dITP diphosphohydrolase
MPTVIVATSNPGKLKEMQAYLGDLNWTLQLKPSHIDVDETGQTFLENARLKASEVAQSTGSWAIADDSGLAVDALGGAPGIYSARYAESDAGRIQKLLSELEDKGDRSAQFVCAIVLARPDGEIALETKGICRGEIAMAPQGDGGFGYDPIFYVPDLGKTFAEMPPSRKKPTAIEALRFGKSCPNW